MDLLKMAKQVHRLRHGTPYRSVAPSTLDLLREFLKFGLW